MPDTFTPNLNLTQPEVGASADLWGNKLNADLAALDALFASSGAGTVVRRDASGNAMVAGAVITAPAGTGRYVTYASGASKRWLSGVEPTPESGSNAGSNLIMQRFADDGVTVLGVSVAVTRSTGVVTFEATPQVGANQIYHQGNLPAVLATVAEPVGTVKMYAGSNGADPAGGFYMLCDGRAISRSTFAALFAVTGTVYGVGDGSTTFNIPNMAERTVVGQSTTQTLIPQFDARILGSAFGEGRHTLTTAELAAHAHTITDPGHKHVITPMRSGGVQSGSGQNAYIPTAPITSQPTDTGAGSFGGDPAVGTGITISNSGAGTAHNVVQPSLVMNYIIRVK